MFNRRLVVARISLWLASCIFAVSLGACGSSKSIVREPGPSGASVTGPGYSAAQPSGTTAPSAATTGGTGSSERAPAASGHGSVEAALKNFRACMRAHGIDYPRPSLGTGGKIFDTSRLSTKSARFVAAQHACVHALMAIFKSANGEIGAGDSQK